LNSERSVKNLSYSWWQKGNMSQGNNYWNLNFGPFADVSYTLPAPQP